MSKSKPMVISYLRFSRPEQLQGDSIRRQLELSEEWAKKRKLTIDTNLSDHGISAFRGANAATGALGTFLELVKSKRIPRGSILLVESLDRLSRTEIRQALTQFLNLINEGIRIVTLTDGREYDEDHCEMTDLMYSIMVMSRAHEESAQKAQRLAAAWKGKRKRMDKEVLTRQIPKWLKVENGKIVEVPEKVATVQKLFQWVLDGYGLTTIVKKANKQLPTLGRKDYWFRSYVFKILHNRAVLGEFQAHRNKYVNGKKVREPVGEVLKDYYPRIIDDQTFNAVQAKLAKGRLSGGPTTKIISIFKGLIFADDNSRLHAVNKGSGWKYVSAAALEGRKGASKYVGVPVTAFEAAFVQQLGRMVCQNVSDETPELRHRLLGIEGELSQLDQRISDVQDALMASETPAPSAVAVLAKLDQRRLALVKAKEQVQSELYTAELGTPKDAADQVFHIIEQAMLSELTPEQRHKLRQLVTQIVQRINVTTSRRGIVVTCEVNVLLQSGQRHQYRIISNDRNREVIRVESGKKRYMVKVANPKSPVAPDETWLKAEEFVRLRKSGMKIGEIAQKFGMTVTTIYRAFHAAGVDPRDIKPQVKSLRWASEAEKKKQQEDVLTFRDEWRKVIELRDQK